MTGEVLPIHAAVERGFVQLTEKGDFITTKAVRDTKSFTITGAIDPKTGREVRAQLVLQCVAWFCQPVWIGAVRERVA